MICQSHSIKGTAGPLPGHVAACQRARQSMLKQSTHLPSNELIQEMPRNLSC